MAQQKKRVSTVRRRRERKNIENGAVHIQSTFRASAVQRSLLRLLHRVLPRRLHALRWSMDSKLLKCMSTVPAPAVRLRSVRSRLLVLKFA